jgi:hypothetical protein
MNGSASLVLSIIFFVAVAIGAVAYAVLVRKARLTDPILLFVFFLCLFVLPLPVRACMTLDIDGDVTDHLLELLPYIPEAVFLTAVSLIVFVVAYYSRLGTVIGDHLPRIRGGTRWRLAFVVLSTLSVFLIAQLAAASGGLVRFVLLGYNVTTDMVGKGYLAMGFTWLFVASMFLLYGYAVERKRRHLFGFTAVFGIVVVMHLVMARRATLLYMGLAVWLFWHHAIRPIRTRTAVIAGIVCFLALNILGNLRGSAYEDSSDFWARTTTNWQELSFSHSMFYTLITGEFVVPFETLPQMIESVGNSVSPEFGMTYLRAPLQVIPQALYPSRPLPLANWYMARFYGSGFGFNEARQFFFLAEGYLNFGIPGLIATALCWGVFFAALHRYMTRAKGDPASILMYSLVVGFISTAISSDFIALLVGLPETSLVAAVIGLWLTRLGSKKQRAFAASPLPA